MMKNNGSYDGSIGHDNGNHFQVMAVTRLLDGDEVGDLIIIIIVIIIIVTIIIIIIIIIVIKIISIRIPIINNIRSELSTGMEKRLRHPVFSWR